MTRWFKKHRQDVLDAWKHNKTSLVETVQALVQLGYSSEQAWDLVQAM